METQSKKDRFLVKSFRYPKYFSIYSIGEIIPEDMLFLNVI